MLPKIEKLAIDRFCTQHKIPILSVVREVKFSNEFIGIDPIMDRNAIFDAYYKSLQEELFIEVKINFAPVSMNMYNPIFDTLAKAKACKPVGIAGVASFFLLHRYVLFFLLCASFLFCCLDNASNR